MTGRDAAELRREIAAELARSHPSQAKRLELEADLLDPDIGRRGRMGEVAIHGFGIAPGESAALGSAKGHPVLMLPGRLDAALAAFLVVGEALLRRLTGAATSGRTMPVNLARKIVSTIGPPVSTGAQGGFGGSPQPELAFRNNQRLPSSR